MKHATPKRTRPKRLDDATTITIRLSRDHLERLDKIVKARGFPSRNEAVRNWIEIESPVE
jgi:predicted DNA binding CopG/RHH family protein